MGTASSSTASQNPNCLTEGTRLVQEWCRFIPICLERICTFSYSRFAPQQNQPEPENPFEQPASSSASSLPCDIFINHRGSDVKHTLATTIYHTLHCMGLRIFLDVEALQPGDVIPEEIQRSMASASLHIAIFSKNYAQSAWCLNELCFMLKTGTKIIPIFYNVQPSDLRNIDQGKGIYFNAFSQLQRKRRYSPEKLQEWKRALNDISWHTGYLVNSNEDEGRLLKNIVNCVLRVLKRVPLEVADHPVGLDELVQKFDEATLQSLPTYHNAKIVGIVGMGGSGKTTLSKELFNRKFPSFDRCSFVSDVRDAADKNALHNKQRKLLKDLGFENFSVDDVEEGRRILSNCLRSLRVLIVIDDVDHKDQLHSLLPNINSLASDSLVIVTTRELGVLNSSNISSIYKMPGLDDFHAAQLLCWHAFLQPSPPCGFEILVKKFVNVCSGLPLSLKVFGGQLYGQKEKYWESTLHKISRILPADIKQTLKISYDALDKEEKAIFLDIACFFIGEEKSLAIAVWDGCGWSGLHSWETLVNKCLVELDDKNHIKMHDQLRDIGREIATEHTPHRLWTSKQILDIQTHSQERMEIRGIVDSTHRAQMEIVGNSSRAFEYLASVFGLKILFVRAHEFGEAIASLSQHLVWLRWYSFQDRNLPSWLSLRNLSVLELYVAGHLEELWDDNVEPPLQLIELRIIDGRSRLRKFPSSIGRLEHLKKIICTNGFGGSSLPEEFCGLQSLEHLELSGSEMLSSLPTDLGELISLQHIDLSYADQLRMLPDSFKKLVNLEYLNLYGCQNLSFRLDMLENITRLEFLDLSSCDKLVELPHQIINQVSLRELDIWGCINLRVIPVNIGTLCKLETLRIGSPLLTSLPTSLGNLSSLNSLGIIGCSMLTSLPCSFGNLSSLTKLFIYECENLERLPHSMGRLNLLRELYIWRSGVREVSEVSVCHVCCPSPKTSIFVGNACLMEMGTLPTSLNSLRLQECKMLKNIKGVGGLLNLQELCIVDCPQLDELPSFADLVSLQSLLIQDCPKVEKIEGLEHCRSLESLTAETCWKVPGIQNLRNLESLKQLELTCDSITALKTCIQSMKDCPCRISISGRVVRFLKPIVKSFEFPDVTVERLEISSKWHEFRQRWINAESKRHLSHWSKGPFFLYSENEEGENENEKPQRKPTAGKVVHIFVSPQDSSGFWSRMSNKFLESKCERKAMLVRGGGGRVVEAFYQLLAHLE